MIDRTKVAGQIDLGENVHAWRFDGNRQGQSVIAMWAVTEAARLQCKLPPDAQVVNSFGRILPAAEILDMELGRMPVYVTIPMSQADKLAKEIARAELKVKDPLQIRNVYLSRREELHLVVFNQINREISARIQVKNREKTIVFQPGSSNIKYELPKSQTGELEIVLNSEYGRQTKTVNIELLPLDHLDNMKINGILSEIDLLKPMVLTERTSVLPADPGIPWDGKQDLSVTAWMGWNQQMLYFAAKVTDDIHIVDREDNQGFWQSDSIQLAIDPQNDSINDYDDNDVEIGFVLGKDKSHVYMTVPDRKEIVCAVAAKRVGNDTIYEAAIPWKELGIQSPQAGKVMAINFVVNDNDGQGRLYWMGLMPGIAEKKQPGVYRKFEFRQ